MNSIRKILETKGLIDLATGWRHNGIRYKKRAVSLLWALFRVALLFGLSFVLLYPLIYMISMAFRQPIDMANPAVIWIPRHVTLDNLKDAFSFMDYPKSLWNTIRLGLVSSLLQVISCSLVGYGFARFQFKLKGLAFALVIFTIVVPPQVVYVPTYMMYKQFDVLGIMKLLSVIIGRDMHINLLDSALTLYLPAMFGVGIRSGLFIYIFRQFYRNLPRELEDAAYIDGCGRLRTFAVIMMPLAGAAILTVTLFSIVWYWNDSYFSVIHFDNLQTVSSFLQGIKSAISDTSSGIREIERIPVTQAAAVVAIAPLLVMYILLQRYFTESIERTGIVG